MGPERLQERAAEEGAVISTTLLSVEDQEVAWLTCGNASAGEFLKIWRAYVHGIDDIIDGDLKGPEETIKVFMCAAYVYTHPFFTANSAALLQIAVNCTNAYADSVAYEKGEGWRKDFSDHYRHFAAEMVLSIASICGGYTHMRKVSPVLREACWDEHHDPEGNAV